MSRIGRKPIVLPEGVSVKVNGDEVEVSGKLGTLKRTIDSRIQLTIENNELTLTRPNDSKECRERHGLYRALLANMVKGVSEGFTKNLTFNGVGYKLQKSGNKLVMNIGLSHSVNFEEVPGIEISVLSNTEVQVKGIDKELVGQIAANIRAIRPVEPYHAYGIRYSDEHVMRKVGKAAGKK